MCLQIVVFPPKTKGRAVRSSCQGKPEASSELVEAKRRALTTVTTAYAVLVGGKIGSMFCLKDARKWSLID